MLMVSVVKQWLCQTKANWKVMREVSLNRDFSRLGLCSLSLRNCVKGK